MTSKGCNHYVAHAAGYNVSEAIIYHEFQQYNCARLDL